MPIGEAVIHVECDKCDYVTDPMSLTALAGGGWDARNIPAKLRQDGWRVEGNNINGAVTVCPECVEKEKT